MSDNDAEVEAVARAIEARIDDYPAIDASQTTIRRIRSEMLARDAIAAMRPAIDRLTARAEAAEREAVSVDAEKDDMMLQRIRADERAEAAEARASRARREALEEAARHLEEEADVLDAQRAELITSGTLNGRRVANEALRKRLARDTRVIIEKLLSDAQYLRALIDSEKGQRE